MDRRRTGSRSMLSAWSAGWKAWNVIGYQVHGIAYNSQQPAQVRDWEYVVISLEHGVCRVGPAAQRAPAHHRSTRWLRRDHW